MICIVYNERPYIGSMRDIIDTLFTYRFTEKRTLEYKLKYCFKNESRCSWASEFTDEELQREAVEYLSKILMRNGGKLFKSYTEEA